jgi:hypothetical protein
VVEVVVMVQEDLLVEALVARVEEELLQLVVVLLLELLIKVMLVETELDPQV